MYGDQHDLIEIVQYTYYIITTERTYGANHLKLVTTTFVQKLYKINKKMPNLFLFLMCWRDPQEELNLDSKLKEFFSWTILNLRMADKSVHFTKFSANLVLNASCAILPSGPVGLYFIKITASYNYVYAQI